MSPPEQDAYVQARAALGPLAQGPAAILSLVGDTCVFGVDALGLRPLWHVETPDEHVFASERGFIPLERYVADPVPLGPGERVALERRDGSWRFLDQAAVRARFVRMRRDRGVVVDGLRERLACGGPPPAPPIDREREIEHFSTRALLGPRPTPRAQRARPWIELLTPILLGGHAPETGLSSDDFRKLARERGTWLVEDVVARFVAEAPRVPVVLEADRDWEEHPRDALARLGAQACRGVRAGARVVVVQDKHVFTEGRAWLDPLLVVAAAHRALGAQRSGAGSLRRQCALIVTAGSLRNLHDLMVALGLGADAVNPYLLLEYAIATSDPDALPNLVEALRKGIEKVCSTLGIHELRGYGRQLSAIGLAPDLAKFIGVETFYGESGLGWERVAEEGFTRASKLRERTEARIEPAFRIWPRAWKAALSVANGEAAYSTYAERLRELETAHPVSLRHLLDFTRPLDGQPAPPTDTSAREHAAPVYISSMSFC